MFKRPQNDARYNWTNHVVGKMLEYRISESLIKRIIRFPTRVEEGIADDTVAVMREAEGQKYSEIWVMYALSPGHLRNGHRVGKKMTIITAWRYPGKSPERDPIPPEIMLEIKDLLNL